jgi:hypothetical protein
MPIVPPHMGCSRSGPVIGPGYDRPKARRRRPQTPVLGRWWRRLRLHWPSNIRIGKRLSVHRADVEGTTRRVR